jgi:hypothetical protein
MPRGNTSSPFQSYVSELRYEPVGLIGYLVRLDPIPANYNVEKAEAGGKDQKTQFEFWEALNRFVREYHDEESECDV